MEKRGTLPFLPSYPGPPMVFLCGVVCCNKAHTKRPLDRVLEVWTSRADRNTLGSWRTVFPVLFNSWLFSDTITFYRLENADYFREGIIPCTIIDFTIIVAVPSTSRKHFISKLMSWCCHHSRKIDVFGQIGRTRFVRIKLSAFLCCSILLLSYCIAYYGMSVVDN